MGEYIDLFWTVIEALGLIVLGATLIAKKTKTQKDDKILGKAHKYIEAIAELKKPK